MKSFAKASHVIATMPVITAQEFRLFAGPAVQSEFDTEFVSLIGAKYNDKSPAVLFGAALLSED